MVKWWLIEQKFLNGGSSENQIEVVLRKQCRFTYISQFFRLPVQKEGKTNLRTTQPFCELLTGWFFSQKAVTTSPFAPLPYSFFKLLLWRLFLHAIQYSLDKLSVHIFWLARLCVWPLDGYRLAAEEKFIDWCVTLFCTISSRYCFTDTMLFFWFQIICSPRVMPCFKLKMLIITILIKIKQFWSN